MSDRMFLFSISQFIAVQCSSKCHVCMNHSYIIIINADLSELNRYEISTRYKNLTVVWFE